MQINALIQNISFLNSKRGQQLDANLIADLSVWLLVNLLSLSVI